MMGFVQGWWGRHQRGVPRMMKLGLLLLLRRDRLMLLLLHVMILRFTLLLIPQLAGLDLATGFEDLLCQNFRIVFLDFADVGNFGPLLRTRSIFARFALGS